MTRQIISVGNIHEATATLDVHVHRVLIATKLEDKQRALEDLTAFGEAILCATDAKVGYHLAPLIPKLIEKLTKADLHELPGLHERAMRHYLGKGR